MKTVFARGFLYSIGIVFNRVVPESIFRFRIFSVYELGPHAANSSTGSNISDVTIRHCRTPAEFAEAMRLTHYNPGQPLSADGKSAPLQATVVIDSDVAVGGVWRSREFFDESELGLRVRLLPEQSWLFAAFISKSHRGQGLYQSLLADVLADVDQRVYASINPTNKSSIAAHRTCIRRKVGTCVAVKIFSWSMCLAGGDLQVHRRERPIELLIGNDA